MGQGWGIRLTERMAGSLTFSKVANGSERFQLHPNIHYPFAFVIHAFNPRPFSYPIKMHFEGQCEMPGFPIAPELKDVVRYPKVFGEMQIDLSGVSYNFECKISGIGQVSVSGKKKYAWKHGGPLNWHQFKKSLIYLPLEIKQGNEIIGKGEMTYLNPLWHFPFGLRICSEQYAFAPRGKLADSLLQIGLGLCPRNAAEFDLEQVKKGIEEQLRCSPYAVYLAIKWNFYFFNFLACLFLGQTFLRSTSEKREQFLATIHRNAYLKFFFLPMLISVLNSMFTDKKFLKEKGQNIIAEIKQVEEEPWRQLNLTPSYGGNREKCVEVDVLVIGSGAGGASLAYELAKKNHAVAIVEEGTYFKRQDFSGMAGEMIRKLYNYHGINFSYSNAALWIPTGKCVGGTTTINSGTCMRTPPSVIKRWENELGLKIDLEPYFSQVEEVLNITPVEPKIQGGIRHVMNKGLEGTSYELKALIRAERGCDGQSFCAIGCPTGAKQSTAVSYVPLALKNNAYLFSNYRVDRLIIQQGEVRGAIASLQNFGPEFDLEIRAKKVVLAAGTFGTPKILKANHLHHHLKDLGQHLTIHPTCTVGGLFPEVVRDRYFVPQSLGVFGLNNPNYCLEGYTLPVDSIAAAFSQFGSELDDIFENINYFTNFSSMISDSVRGQLIFTPWGVLPEYMFDGKMCQMAKESSMLIAEIFMKAKAKKIYLPFIGSDVIESSDQLAKISRKKLSPNQITFSAHHPLGTCRMGGHPDSSVVDIYGQVWGVKNLFVSDGSVIPGPLGVNPQVTIMANSLRIAEHIHTQLQQG